jgi:hypothetical protein
MTAQMNLSQVLGSAGDSDCYYDGGLAWLLGSGGSRCGTLLEGNLEAQQISGACYMK